MSPPGRSGKSMPRLLLRSVFSCPSVIFYLRLSSWQFAEFTTSSADHCYMVQLFTVSRGLTVTTSAQACLGCCWLVLQAPAERLFFFSRSCQTSAVGPFPIPGNFSTSQHWTCIVHIELCAVGALENRTQVHLHRLPLRGQIPTQTQYCNSHIRLHFSPPPKPKDGVSFGRNVLNPPVEIQTLVELISTSLLGDCVYPLR